MKLVFVDFDGILAKILMRLAKAFEMYCQSVPEELAWLRTESAAKNNDIYWQCVFLPQLVPLDEYMEGSAEALDELERRGYQIIILTSRIDTMYEASIEWLQQHGLLTPPRRLVMKPAKMKIGTPLLKAVDVYALASFLMAHEVLYIDDQKVNGDEVGKYITCTFRQAQSLEEALEITAEQATEIA